MEARKSNLSDYSREEIQKIVQRDAEALIADLKSIQWGKKGYVDLGQRIEFEDFSNDDIYLDSMIKLLRKWGFICCYRNDKKGRKIVIGIPDKKDEQPTKTVAGELYEFWEKEYLRAKQEATKKAKEWIAEVAKLDTQKKDGWDFSTCFYGENVFLEQALEQEKKSYIPMRVQFIKDAKFGYYMADRPLESWR